MDPVNLAHTNDLIQARVTVTTCKEGINCMSR